MSITKVLVIYSGDPTGEEGVDGVTPLPPPNYEKFSFFTNRKENFSCVLLEKIFTHPQC